MSHASCYHCGLPIPDDVDLSVTVAGEPRPMCCFGCQAVAQSIVENGLDDYYRSRDAMPESPREAVPAILDQLALFDHADFQKSFVKELGECEREASLLLEGITCAACIWLNEQHVSRLPGVTGVDINYATRRARVRWDESRTRLSDILAAIAAIGYRAYPYDAARSEALARRCRPGRSCSGRATRSTSVPRGRVAPIAASRPAAVPVASTTMARKRFSSPSLCFSTWIWCATRFRKTRKAGPKTLISSIN